MKLHPPFIISARLTPALKIGDATLCLAAIGEGKGREGRDQATMILDFGAGGEYRDSTMQSGVQGFSDHVAIFHTFLGFMSACAESMAYERRTGTRSENADLFPPEVARWCDDNASEIEAALCDLQDEAGNPRSDLIQE